VIPSTALGLLIFVAALGPGFVYLRTAERRAPRPDRSGLLEAVELTITGAAASTAATLLVTLVGASAGIFSIDRAARHPSRYAHNHGFALVVLVTVDLLLAYLLAYGSARAIHRRQPPSIRPAGTSWLDAFIEERPTSEHLVVLNVELRDARRITGVLRSFTTGLEDSRELGLVAPIAVRADANTPPITLHDTFMLIREGDVVALSGRYVQGVSAVHESDARFSLRRPARALGRRLASL
jgi:hypothetical protein